ncbi:hypothetical protein GWK47_052229 [Chionoecetes opilio]|uniref:Uncharacterized protein n=1 Tax=Chionoecetes opilio TaxID=41210 RepID=A0A8J4Y955_CHIOP|nr:hypothetical protein GWK47_052229 [Chionoecetes opilio]
MINYLPNTNPWGLTGDLNSLSSHISLWYPYRYIPRMCPSTHSTWTFTSTLKRTYLYFLLHHNAFQFVHFTCKAHFQVFDRLQNSLKRISTPFTTLSLDPSHYLYHTSFNLSLLHSYHTTTLNPRRSTQHHFSLRLHNTLHHRRSHSNPESSTKTQPHSTETSGELNAKLS